MLAEINFERARPRDPKKRILFVATQSEAGGAQQFLLHLLSRLPKDRYDIHAAAGREGGSFLYSSLNTLSIPCYRVDSLRRDISPFQDISAVLELRKLIKKIEPETLFLLSSKAGFIGALAAKLIGRKMSPKVIYRIGGWTFNDPWPRWKKNLWISLERLSAKWKDVIIVNNLRGLEQARALKIKPRQTLTLIYNGIDPYRLELLPKDDAVREILRAAGIDMSKSTPKIIGTIANFYPAKGLEYLIRSARLIKDANVIFCIIGEGRERPRLESLIRESGLEDKVFLIGRRDRAARFLSAFDIYVLPSVKEGFPWSVLEAMSAKLPIVATGVGAIPEMIDDAINGYIVPPKNPGQIADKINLFLSNDSLAREMGIRAHQKALFSFTLDKMVDRIESLL